MKILYVTSSYDVIDIKFVSSLKSRNHEIAVFVIRPRIIRIEDKVKGVTYSYMSYETSNKYFYLLSYFLSFIKTIIRTRDYIELHKPDVVHGGNTQTAGFLCSLLGFHPFLLMPQGTDILVNPNKLRLARIITQYTVNKADSVVCDAVEVSDKVIRLTNYKKKITIFPRGVDLNIFEPSKSTALRSKLSWNDKVVFICTRAHYPIYGVEYIIRAFREVAKINKNFGLLLIDYKPKSSGSLTAKFRQMIKNYELDTLVHILPPVSNDKIPTYLNNSDVYISTSLSDGTSVSMLEAMACGLPVIVTDLPGNKEWIKNDYNGYIVPKRDIKLLSRSILKLICKGSKRKQMGQRNTEIARQRANWNEHITTLEKTYNIIKS